MESKGPSLKDRYAVFAKKTTFHGFREFHDSTSLCQKGVWALVLLLCTAMLAMFVTEQTSQYIEGQTATRVSRLESASSSSPPVLLQLHDWSGIDVQKVKKLGITPEEMAIAMGYVQVVPYTFETPPADAQKRLRATMKRLNVQEILQFYSLIARRSFDGILPESLSAKNVFLYSIYYHMVNTSSKKQAPFGESSWIEFQFNFTSFQSIRKEQYAFQNWTFSDYDIKMLLPTLLNIDTYMEIAIRPGYVYLFNTQSSIYRKMSDCTRDHPIDDFYFIKQCKLDCELRANVSLGATSCIVYSERIFSIELTESYQNGNVTFCYLGYFNVTSGMTEGAEEPIFRELTQNQIDQRAMEVELCQKRCLPRCDQWTTSWSLASFQYDYMTRENLAAIRIVFPDVESLVVFEEFQQYEWYDLVSDLGGLLGLWLGASMMSLFQTFHLCCFSEAKQKPREGDPRNLGRSRGAVTRSVAPYPVAWS